VRTPRVFVDKPLVAGESVALEMGAVRHLLQVLRLRSGDPLLLFNGDGQDWHATLESATKRSASARIGRPARDEPEPRLHIHLLLGISKGERMDYAIQKAVELGVDRITPMLTQRVVVKLDRARLTRRTRHWQGIIRNACEQSGRSRVPALEEAVDLRRALQTAPATGILLDPTAEQSLLDLARPDTNVTLLIGPEGGLTTHERTAALAAGYQAIRIGPRVLRTETAPLAALAALQALWGDFR
jgi:16S rRNA (uracil1498-N3)-methyltransferase